MEITATQRVQDLYEAQLRGQARSEVKLQNEALRGCGCGISSRILKAAICLALLLLFAFSARAADELEGYARQFSSVMPAGDAVLAQRALEEAGVGAFPTLLAHLNDRAPVQDNRLASDATRRPTVGELCFSILQDKIEGSRPKGFRQYYVLTPANARQWLEAHNTPSLRQLQVASREESLRRAEAELARFPADEAARGAAADLRREIAKLKQ